MSIQNTVIKSIRIIIKGLSLVSLKAATNFANHLWLRPIKMPIRPSDKSIYEKSDRFDVVARGQAYQVQSWGTGPLVVLVHGWDGRGSQMYSFIAPLVARGYQVVTFDIPAHGNAAGNQVDPPLAAEVVKAIATRCGPVEAFVTHSFGSTWTLIAVAAGVSVKKMALLSPPQSLRKIYDKFQQRLGIPKRVGQSLTKKLEQIHGDLWNNYSNEMLVKRLKGISAIVIHDEGDKEIAFDEGLTVAKAWNGCEFMKTTGLGHYRILKSENVIDRVVNLIAGEEAGKEILKPNKNVAAQTGI